MSIFVLVSLVIVLSQPGASTSRSVVMYVAPMNRTVAEKAILDRCYRLKLVSNEDHVTRYGGRRKASEKEEEQ